MPGLARDSTVQQVPNSNSQKMPAKLKFIKRNVKASLASVGEWLCPLERGSFIQAKKCDNKRISSTAQFSSISNMEAKMQLDNNFAPICMARLDLEGASS